MGAGLSGLVMAVAAMVNKRFPRPVHLALQPARSKEGGLRPRGRRGNIVELLPIARRFLLACCSACSCQFLPLARSFADGWPSPAPAGERRSRAPAGRSSTKPLPTTPRSRRRWPPIRLCRAGARQLRRRAHHGQATCATSALRRPIRSQRDGLGRVHRRLAELHPRAVAAWRLAGRLHRARWPADRDQFPHETPLPKSRVIRVVRDLLALCCW